MIFYCIYYYLKFFFTIFTILFICKDVRKKNDKSKKLTFLCIFIDNNKIRCILFNNCIKLLRFGFLLYLIIQILCYSLITYRYLFQFFKVNINRLICLHIVLIILLCNFKLFSAVIKCLFYLLNIFVIQAYQNDLQIKQMTQIFRTWSRYIIRTKSNSLFNYSNLHFNFIYYFNITVEI